MYVPRITSVEAVVPLALQSLIREAAASGVAGCNTVGSAAGLRQVVIAATQSFSASYDITQCDFHTGGLNALFVMDDQTLFLAHGLELSNTVYGLCGILMILIVSCTAQNIVHLINQQKSRPAHPDVCLTVCAVTLAAVIATAENTLFTTSGSHILVTTEEVIAFWYMTAYCVIRTLRAAAVRVGLAEAAGHCYVTTTTTKAKHDQMRPSDQVNDQYYNLLVTLLHLLASRIYMTMSTPYTIWFALLIGLRLFLKLYQPHPSVWHRLVILADAALLQLLLWAGVMPQFVTTTAAYAAIMVLVFMCVSTARMISTLNDSCPRC